MAGVVRQIVFGIDPLKGVSGTYSWSSIADGNSDGYVFTCAHVPNSKSVKLSNLQDTMFIGTKARNHFLHTFRNDLAQDDGVNFSAEMITNRIDPTYQGGEAPDAKRFLSIEFPHINPLDKGLSMSFVPEAEAPHEVSPTWTSFFYEAGKTLAYFPSGLGRWMHIRIVDNTAYVNRNVFSQFLVHFYRLFKRDGEAT